MAVNPVKLASLQADSTANNDWSAVFERVMSLSQGRSGFGTQPFANRLNAILEAVVPARKNPTHEKVLAIVNALRETGAIRREEVAGVYDALLQRVSKYNSTNAQANLSTLVGDVREAVAQQVRHAEENLGSLAALNGFLSTLPANVPRGQADYTGFVSALRLLTAEVPSTLVYQAGPDYFLQSSRNGTQTVNLTSAFRNLADLWGVRAPSSERLAVSSLLTPNTRLLLLLIAPFTDSATVSRDTYLGYLMTLYREALGRVNVNDRTRQEIQAVSRAIGQDESQLEATLNFLLTNRTQVRPVEYALSPAEERVLRYVQQAIALQMSQNGRPPEEALDAVAANIDTSFYARNRDFVLKLMDFFRRALTASREYFADAIMNPMWLPPEGFFTGIYDFPAAREDYIWDNEEVAAGPSQPSSLREAEPKVPQGAAASAKYEKSNSSKEISSLSQRLARSWSFRPGFSSMNKYRLLGEDSEEEESLRSLGPAPPKGMFDHLKPKGPRQ